MLVRLTLNTVILSLLYLVSHYLVKYTTISKFPLFEATSAFTYFGVLIGFAITIYTFGLSMIPSIKTGIDSSNNPMKVEDKAKSLESIISAFNEIKEDIWVIFLSLIGVIIVTVFKDIINPFGWKVESWKVPEKTTITLFFYSTFCMYDIIKALFNLAEINMKLLK